MVAAVAAVITAILFSARATPDRALQSAESAPVDTPRAALQSFSTD
jgi:hypothetical protein